MLICVFFTLCVFCCVFCFFFFKQKTAYEMRISDWSSDVCSSDLAVLTVADADEARAAGLAAELGCKSVPVREIMRVAADVFSPCALGAILDEQSIAGLDAAVVAGAAHNQLATPADGERLLSKGLLYRSEEHTSELQSLMRNSYS